ncbi:DNA repair exonuclease [Candidatus Dojkabacteria bacterium]|uniref:DNA repair exonuclease n=1 Tax=Candidatus Dojkabacteria bacterium TaxID=2099670 RepID=A0A955RJE9_9BACT|nr:DNA repair exonuclease [Candidatus Dojkabacteria bacterium]
MSLKLIHTADVHLGARLKYLGDKANEHRVTIEKTFQKVITKAIDSNADVFVVAGDLFDNPFPDKRYIDLVINELNKLLANDIYVVIVPGNHDRLAAGSVYLSDSFNITNPKFKLFSSKEFEQWVIPELELTIHAKGLYEQKSKQSQLTGLKKNDSSKYNVAVVHGSVDIIAEPDNYPIFQKDIQGLDFDYLALGDWHSSLKVDSGKTTAWYSGSPEVISVSQKGAGHCLLVTIDETTKVEAIDIGSRNIKELEVDLNKYSSQAKLVDDIEKYKDDNSILLLNIKGIKELEQRIDTDRLSEQINNLFYYVRVKDNTELGLSQEELDKYPEELVIGKYIRILQKKKAENPQLEKEIDTALQLGVKYLKGAGDDN